MRLYANFVLLVLNELIQYAVDLLSVPHRKQKCAYSKCIFMKYAHNDRYLNK